MRETRKRPRAFRLLRLFAAIRRIPFHSTALPTIALLGAATFVRALSAEAPDPETLQAQVKEGELRARGVCQQCHLFPDPSLLDKKSWEKYVLPKMRLYAGLLSLDQVKTDEPELVKASGIIPSVPRIPRPWWPSIETYYL